MLYELVKNIAASTSDKTELDKLQEALANDKTLSFDDRAKLYVDLTELKASDNALDECISKVIILILGEGLTEERIALCRFLRAEIGRLRESIITVDENSPATMIKSYASLLGLETGRGQTKSKMIKAIRDRLQK